MPGDPTATPAVPDGTRVRHEIGEYIKFPLGGLSGTPVAWIEDNAGGGVGNASFDLRCCTIAHELGHSVLSYTDLDERGLEHLAHEVDGLGLEPLA